MKQQKHSQFSIFNSPFATGITETIGFDSQNIKRAVMSIHYQFSTLHFQFALQGMMQELLTGKTRLINGELKVENG